MKRWIVGLLVLLLAGGLGLPQCAANINFFYTRQYGAISWSPGDGWAAVLQGGMPLYFYLLLVALLALILLCILLTGSSLKYKSGMLEITPEIRTPEPAGQGQFGTARWMTPKEVRKAYGVWKVPKHSLGFAALVEAGKHDREVMEHAAVQIGKAE